MIYIFTFINIKLKIIIFCKLKIMLYFYIIQKIIKKKLYMKLLHM